MQNRAGKQWGMVVVEVVVEATIQRMRRENAWDMMNNDELRTEGCARRTKERRKGGERQITSPRITLCERRKREEKERKRRGEMKRNQKSHFNQSKRKKRIKQQNTQKERKKPSSFCCAHAVKKAAHWDRNKTEHAGIYRCCDDLGDDDAVVLQRTARLNTNMTQVLRKQKYINEVKKVVVYVCVRA